MYAKRTLQRITKVLWCALSEKSGNYVFNYSFKCIFKKRYSTPIALPRKSNKTRVTTALFRKSKLRLPNTFAKNLHTFINKLSSCGNEILFTNTFLSSKQKECCKETYYCSHIQNIFFKITFYEASL